MTDETDTYPVWTIRCTWRVTNGRDEPVTTHHGAPDEANATDRARFMLERYHSTAVRELVMVEVKQPDGSWAAMGRGERSPDPAVRFAFQRPPVRPV